MKLLTRTLSLALLTLAAACGGANSAAVGTYHLDVDAMMKAMPMPPGVAETAEGKKMMEEMKKSMAGHIELKADNTAAFHLKMSMMGQNNETNETGTWKLAGDQLTMTMKKDGKDDSKTATCKDGVITVSEDDGGKKMTMTFRKK